MNDQTNQAVQPPPPPPPDAEISKPDDGACLWATLAHLSSLAGGLVTSAWGGGWGCFVGPLVIWLLKKDESSFVDEHGKEALNFNITIAIISLVLWVFVVGTLGIGLIIALPLWGILAIYWLVCTLIASVKANQGKRYRYPLTFRFLK